MGLFQNFPLIDHYQLRNHFLETAGRKMNTWVQHARDRAAIVFNSILGIILAFIGQRAPEKFTQVTKLRVTFSAALLFSFVYASPSFAQEFDPDDTIIVYGGFGYLDGEQQPWLHDLIRRGSDGRSKYVGLGSSLQRDVRSAAQRDLSDSDFSRWTSYPIIYSSTDLLNAHKIKSGSESLSTRDAFSSFGRAYLLVFSGGFEHDARYTQVQDGGLVFAYSAVGVSATLVDLKGGNEILLSATHMGILGVQEDARKLNALNSDEETVGRFAQIYREGAAGAMSSLAKLARSSNPKSISKAWDVYAVTGGFVPDREVSKFAAELFDWTPAAEFGSFCQPLNYCDPSSQACKAMLGYLTTATSEVLSKSGYRVLPPLSWQNQAQKSSSIALRTLSLPSSGLPDIVQSAQVNYDPKQATVKVVPVLAAATVTAGISKDGTFSADAYSAVTVLQAARTDTGACDTVIEEFGLGKMSQATVTDSARHNDSVTDLSGQQLITLRAIRESVLSTEGIPQ
ncbi:MAG: hypothetical protein AAF996_04775 [Pseudomonadota bacterium]